MNIEDIDINKIFGNIEKKIYHNLDFKKKIKIYNGDKVKEISISDYLFYFYNVVYKLTQNMSNVLGILEYIYYEIPNNKNNLWVDKTCVGDIFIIYDEDLLFSMFNKNNFQDELILDKDDEYLNSFVTFCKDLIIKTKNCIISVSFLQIHKRTKGGHQNVLFSSFENSKKLLLYNYDPMGNISESTKPSHLFLENIKTCIEIHTNIKVEIITYKIDNYALQNIINEEFLYKFDVKQYCMLYSLYFVYCVFHVLHFMHSSGKKIKMENIFKYAFKLRKNNCEEMYNFVVCFASTIKDNYLHFLQNNYSQEEYNILLEYVNNNIINHVFPNNKKEETKE